MVNADKNIWLALSLQDAFNRDKNQAPNPIMFLGVLTIDGDGIPPFVFPHCLRQTMEAYKTCFEDHPGLVRKGGCWKTPCQTK